MATKLEGGGGTKALVVGPLKNDKPFQILTYGRCVANSLIRIENTMVLINCANYNMMFKKEKIVDGTYARW